MDSILCRSANKIRGTKVLSTQGTLVGVIRYILVNPESGITLFIILCYSGFAGNKHWHLAVPGSSVTFDDSRPALCYLDIDAQQLMEAPDISVAEMVGDAGGPMVENFKPGRNFTPVCKLLT